jgi:8-oxo-dGTP pyrophosphatase MutT (NUDIX family)
MMLATIESDAFEQRALDYLRSEPPGILDPKGNPTGDHELEMDGRPFVMASLPKPAAVLVPIVMHADEPTVLLTERASNLRDHSGQIAFPGGKIDADDPSPLDTALREADEEIGLDAGDVEIIGALPPTPTIATDYAVYPFVGLIEPGRRWRPSAAEVAEVLEFPLDRLRAGYARRRLLRRGVPFRTDVYCVDDQLIWGATARIVADLLERVPDELR